MPSKTAKKSTKTTTRQSGAATGKSAVKRATVASLALDLKSLEKRLKGADTKNRKALTALETVVEGVKASAKNTTTAQKAALTRGLNTLEIRMETYLERAASDARAGVKSELSSVTASGADLSTLEQAVHAAHTRLDDLDTTQRNALARLNRHIASIATSVDSRLKEEAQAREDSTATLDAKIDSVRETIETRVNRVEQDTADALQVVGDRITEFASVLENRATTSDVDTAERLADLAQETQAEFNSVHTDVTTRLEALEMIASAWSPSEPVAPTANLYAPANADDPRIDQMGEMIQTLQDELSRMHARMAAVSANSNGQPTAPSNVVSMAPILSAQQENPYAEAVRALEIKTAEPAAPVVEAPVVPTPEPARESHLPQEYDPSAYAAQAPLPTITEPAIVTPLMAAPLAAIPAAVQAAPPVPPVPPALPTPPAPPPMASAGTFEMPKVDPLPTIDSYVPDVEPLMPAPLPVSTYDDPAYAENDEMRAERIGGDFSKPSILSNLPITGRNLRVGALVVGVSVVGLLAGKTILGGSDKAQLVTNDVPAVEAVEGGVQNTGFANSNPNDFSDTPAQASEPLGLYAETQTPTIGAGKQNSLDAAVEAGNPIAQFQKGLVKLQSGQMKEGARLIRLAANRNQPAAQYRLAKLYESGTGISKDTVTARELIERAASGGNRIAMHDLGNYYAYGQGGLDRDMGQALDWFTKAAERGVVDSQFNVAFLREGNEGVTADLETAMFWYLVAARQGDQGAPDRINALKNEFDASTLNDIQTRAARFNPKPVDEAANGVFRNVSWNKIAPQTAAADAAVKSAEIIRVRDAQTLLTSLGYEVGAADGISGEKTRDAVKSFEAVNGLPETGQVTEELIRKLEIATGA